MVSEWEVVDYTMSDGNVTQIRQRWECDPPGPIGSGIDFLATDVHWTLAADGMWERVIYRWKPV